MQTETWCKHLENDDCASWQNERFYFNLINSTSDYIFRLYGISNRSEKRCQVKQVVDYEHGGAQHLLSDEQMM
jgi:hypothetical protein